MNKERTVLMSGAPRSSREAKDLFTRFASHASSVADVFVAAFGGTPLGISTVDLTRPNETTGGGRRAMQHIRLVHPSGKALVVGHVDVPTGRAGLRSYAWLVRAYPARFGIPFDVHPNTFMAFAKQVKDLLFTLSIELEPITDDAPEEEDEPPPKPRLTRLAVAGAFLTLCVLGMLGMLVWVFLLR